MSALDFPVVICRLRRWIRLAWSGCNVHSINWAQPPWIFSSPWNVLCLLDVLLFLQRFVGEHLRPDDVLKNIARFNTGLDTRFWRVFFSLNRSRSDGRRFLVIGVDENSLQVLENCNYKIFYRFTQNTLKLSEIIIIN